MTARASAGATARPGFDRARFLGRAALGVAWRASSSGLVALLSVASLACRDEGDGTVRCLVDDADTATCSVGDGRVMGDGRQEVCFGVEVTCKNGRVLRKSGYCVRHARGEKAARVVSRTSVETEGLVCDQLAKVRAVEVQVRALP